VGVKALGAKTKRPYDIAISFSGEDRKLTNALVKALQFNGIKVFYDEFEQSSLWGKDLYQFLSEIYKDLARFCVVMVSRHYLKKKWTRHELKSAQARAFLQKKEYILPIKLDATELPGINPTTGYIDASLHDIRDIVDLIAKKLGRETSDLSNHLRRNWDGQFVIYNGVRMASYWPEMIQRAQKNTKLTFVTKLPRIQYGEETRFDGRKLPKNCPDCGVKKKQFHVLSCDKEECANCGDQLIMCECVTTDDYVRLPRLG
jgi:hypothetical protein